MKANEDCSDSDCRRLQDHYKINAESARLPSLKKKQKTPEQTAPSENDWGIEIVAQEQPEEDVNSIEEQKAADT